MRSIKLFIMFLMLGAGARAQTTAEWFNQKKTQIRYLLQQISALQTYRASLRNGYHIASDGLGSISGHLDNEHTLHTGYYDHLQKVNPVVKSNPQVSEILRWQSDILTQTSRINKTVLSPAENRYVASVCAALLKDCDAQLTDLQTVLKDSKVTMDDEARLRQIARIHDNMQNNYRFVAGFRGQVAVYAHNRQQQQDDLNTLNKLYGNR